MPAALLAARARRTGVRDRITDLCLYAGGTRSAPMATPTIVQGSVP